MAIQTLISELIDKAYREINVLNETESADENQLRRGMEKLNSMMAAWKEDSKVVPGWKYTETATDTLTVPDWAESAMYHALAVELAPQSGASVSMELVTKVEYYLNIVTRKTLVENQENRDLTHLPAGSGHFGSHRWDISSDS